MPGAFSDYMENAVLQWFRATNMPAAPATLWFGLLTAQPADTGTAASPADGTEVTSASAYARVSATASSFFGAPAASGTTQQITGGSTVTFPQATGAWGTITGYGVYDSLPQATPAAPSATGNTGTGSAFTAAQTANVAVSYLTPGGETLASANTLVTIGSNANNIVVTLPSFPTGVTGMNVYVSTSSGSATLFKTNSGAGATSTTSGGTVTVTGFAPNTNSVVPASNTSAGHLLYYDAISNSQAIGNGQTPSLAGSQLVLSLD